MDLLSTIDKHSVSTDANDVSEICRPIFESLNLNYFDYTRAYADGTFTSLASDKAWFRHFFANNYHISSSIIDKGIHLWNSYQSDKVVSDAAQLFNHHNGITIFKQQEGYCEFYDFAAPEDNHRISSIYLNNIDVLEKFFCYFQDKAQELIKRANQQRIILPPENIGEKLHDLSGELDSLLKKIKPKNYPVNIFGTEVNITAREMECLVLLAQGKTLAHVAGDLDISPRTVESHVESAKHKLSSYNRSQLLEIIRQNYPLLLT